MSQLTIWIRQKAALPVLRLAGVLVVLWTLVPSVLPEKASKPEKEPQKLTVYGVREICLAIIVFINLQLWLIIKCRYSDLIYVDNIVILSETFHEFQCHASLHSTSTKPRVALLVLSLPGAKEVW